MANKVISVIPEKMLEGHFLSANAEQFWHFLMKTKKAAGTYEERAVEDRVQEIIAKKGSNSFTWASDRGWTPAHVAVLSNNEAGLEFLKRKGALAKDVCDENGDTPIKLAKKFRPAFLKLFEEESSSSAEELSFLAPLYSERQVELPETFFDYASNSDDFGVELQALLFAKPNDETRGFQENFKRSGVKIDHFAKNMVYFAKRFGFEIFFSQHQYALRDNLIRLPDGSVVIAAHSKNTGVALERIASRALFFRDKAAYRTNHLFFKGELGSAHEQAGKAGADMSDFFGATAESMPALRFYMEGGNHYVMTNHFGKKMVLLGEDSLYTAHAQMRRDEVFKDPLLRMTPLINSYSKELSASPDLLMRTLQEMYSQGLLVKGKGKERGLISRAEIAEVIDRCDRMRSSNEQQPYQLDGNPYLDSAKDEGFYSPLKLDEQQMKSGIGIAAVYLAQRAFTKQIIAMSFSVEPGQLVFVPQLDYHLDIFLRPGPNGSVFVQDYSFCTQVLRGISRQSEALGLTELDQRMLKRYLATAEKLDRELGPLCANVKEELAAAGLKVIPTPGVFYDVSPDLLNPQNPDEATTYNLNFLNAITGWSPKEKSHFYLTTGAGVGDRLGGVLMRSFETFIKRYQPDTQVGFLGYDPERREDFSEGMRWHNRRGSQLGLHCLSFALKTASHANAK